MIVNVVKKQKEVYVGKKKEVSQRPEEIKILKTNRKIKKQKNSNIKKVKLVGPCSQNH